MFISKDRDVLTDVTDDHQRKLIEIILKNKKLTSDFISIPKKLYQYRHINDYSIKQIINDNAYLAQPSTFNDPFDSNFTKIILKKAVKDFYQEYFNNETFIEKYNENKKILNDRVKIACFTPLNDNILMWSYYGYSHKGICIEYDTTQSKNLFLPVIYSNKIHEINSVIKNRILKSKNNDLKFEIDNTVTNLISICKLKIWEHEKEWRFIKPSEAKYKEFIDIKVSGIYLGLNIQEEDQEKIICIAKEKRIPVYKIYLDDDNYILKNKQIN